MSAASRSSSSISSISSRYRSRPELLDVLKVQLQLRSLLWRVPRMKSSLIVPYEAANRAENTRKLNILNLADQILEEEASRQAERPLLEDDDVLLMDSNVKPVADVTLHMKPYSASAPHGKGCPVAPR